MELPDEIRTARLILRRWRPDDLAPLGRMNADPRVIEHFPDLLSPVDCQRMIDRIAAHFETFGFGFWALELVHGGAFIGFTGLSHPPFDAPFTPCVEVGWRLAAEHWGMGYATEAALAALTVGFETIGLVEIVSFTVPANRRSIRVMEKIGMRRNRAEDFDHPRIAEEHPLRRHVLYRMDRAMWNARGPVNARPMTSGKTTIE